MNKTIKIDDAENLKARVVELKNLADYQTGSIVSREIASQETGTVTIFAFDKGQQLSEHAAPFDAIVIGLDGEAEVFIAGEPNRIKTGDMIIMPANIPHAVKAFSRFKMMLVMIRK